MNIWIDLGHTPQYNFYKNFILRLASEGHHVYVTVLERGKMPVIIKKEIGEVPNVSIDIIGKHRFNKISAILDANLLRIVRLFRWSLNKKIDIAFSNSFLVGIVAKIRGIKSFAFGDDVRKMDFVLKSWFNKKSYYCVYSLPQGFPAKASNAEVLPVLKEWAYLSPEVYTPDEKALDEYGVSPKEYVFLREVSVGTVNYTGQASGAIYDVIKYLPKDKKVLLSLEDKSKRDLYPSDWILLQEPIKDIHSLIYYSAALASSGDSMAREAALLGVPAYYLGIRHSMPANLAASKVADFSNEKTLPFEDWVKRISLPKEVLIQNQNKLRLSLKNEFVDVNEFMYQLTKANL